MHDEEFGSVLLPDIVIVICDVLTVLTCFLCSVKSKNGSRSKTMTNTERWENSDYYETSQLELVMGEEGKERECEEKRQKEEECECEEEEVKADVNETNTESHTDVITS